MGKNQRAMLFSSRIPLITRVGAQRLTNSASLGARRQSSAVPLNVLKGWYDVFGSSTAGYVMWIVGGVLVSEFITGTVTDVAWNSANKGRTYDSVDWTKFIVEDDDDDEDEEEEEEEEEGGDDEEEEDDE